MNSLSWLLYIADVIGGISTLCMLIGLLITVFIIFFWIARMATAGAIEQRHFPSETNPMGMKEYRAWVFVSGQTQSKALYFFAFIMIATSILIPSKQTIYMIAASEAGEVVIKSPEAQEVFNGMKDIIRTQLEQYKNKATQ